MHQVSKEKDPIQVMSRRTFTRSLEAKESHDFHLRLKKWDVFEEIMNGAYENYKFLNIVWK